MLSACVGTLLCLVVYRQLCQIYVAKQVWKYKSIGHWSIGGLGKRWLEDQCRDVKKISLTHT